ncbi:hypothetical protein WN51_02118 [Melipona quadrifasciata]|uniref:Uncharacterized protein n=1 Tax=Melipona quadrifasciata TaxID=166423 RepID=A0A0M8ZZ90_9HYME|nr:hypothetical protein WN51_02118 [Melipona quadrifasciata]
MNNITLYHFNVKFISHNGTPWDNFVRSVRESLSKMFGSRWIWRRPGPHFWPSRSLDLIPLLCVPHTKIVLRLMTTVQIPYPNTTMDLPIIQYYPSGFRNSGSMNMEKQKELEKMLPKNLIEEIDRLLHVQKINATEPKIGNHARSTD